MTAFYPISSYEAAEFVERAGIPEARRIMVDFAAAGLLKAYARVIETSDASGACNIVRGAAVPVFLWKRIINEGLADDVWSGGTVRLKGSDLIGGLPTVEITGIGFSAKFVHQVVDQYRARSIRPHRPTKAPAAPVAEVISVADKPSVHCRQPDPSAIPDGALTVTIKQAGAALGFGRTKINDLMGAKLLERVDIDGSVRITTASIRALAGARIGDKLDREPDIKPAVSRCRC